MRSIFLLIPFLFSGCVSESHVEEVEGSTAVIALFMLFGFIAFNYISPKIPKWKYTQNMMNFFITKLSMLTIGLMVFLGILFIFNGLKGILVAINLFISAAFLYKLRHDFFDKDDNIKTQETRYFTMTLPTLFVLLFLFFGGLRSVLGF